VIKEGTHLAEKVIRAFLPQVPTLPDQDELHLGGRERVPGCLSCLQAEGIVFAPQEEHRMVQPGNFCGDVVFTLLRYALHGQPKRSDEEDDAQQERPPGAAQGGHRLPGFAVDRDPSGPA
jgi:hypothetical protein